MTFDPAVRPAARTIPSVSGNGVTWYHVHASTLGDLDFVSGLFPVNRFDLLDCISLRRLPTVVDRDGYLFAIFHVPRFVAEKKTVVPRQLGVFLNDKVLVTVYQSEVKPVDTLFMACTNGADGRKELPGRDPADLLYRILDALVEYLFPMLDKSLEALENIEDEVFDDRSSSARQLNMLRRDIVDQRRILFPLEKLVSEIQVKSKRYGHSNLDLHYEDLIDKVTKVWDTLESARERIEIFKDADHVLSTEKTNKVLALLTIVFTLSIPATVLGTLMGMNVNLPGGIETGAWMFLGSYTTFFLVLLASLVPAVLMIWLFRRWGWL